MNKHTDEASKKNLKKVHAIYENIYCIDMDHVISKERLTEGLKNLDVSELMELDESVRHQLDCTKHYTNVLKYNLREVLDNDVIKTSDILDVYGQVINDLEGREITYLFSNILTFARFCKHFDIPREVKGNNY